MEQRVIPSDLAACLSERRGTDRAAAEAYVRELFLLIEDGLRAESIVKIKGLGTFKLVRVEARESININTGQRFTIEEHTKVSFTPDTPLKNQINKPFSEFETVVLNDDVDISALEAIGAEEQSDDDNDDDTNNAAEQGAAAVEEPAAAPDSDASTNLDNPTTQPASTTLDNTRQSSTTLENPVTQPAETEPEEAGAEAEPESEEPETDSDAPITLETPATQPTEPEEPEPEKPEPEEPEPEPDSDASTTLDNTRESSTTLESPKTQPEPEREEPEPTAPLTQHIETQHVTDMTVTNQHIEHQTIETPHQMEQNAPARLSIWETLALMTFILALMTLSYVAGYNHWLTWDEPQNPAATTVQTPAKSAKTATDKQPAASPTASSSASSAASPTASPSASSSASPSASSAANPQQTTVSPAVVTPANPAATPTVVTPAKPAATQPPLQPAKPAADASANYPQVPGGEYLIVGEQGEHIVKAGDSLRGIALKYYGSKNYVRYIVCMNAIKNPDIVNIGQRIKLPKLEKKAQ